MHFWPRREVDHVFSARERGEWITWEWLRGKKLFFYTIVFVYPNTARIAMY